MSTLRAPVVFFIFLSLAWTIFADEIELMTGLTVEGEITLKDERYVSIDVTVNHKKMSRKFPLDRVHAITQSGERKMINPKKDGAMVNTQKNRTATDVRNTVRTKQEVDQLIKEAGEKRPEWWDQTKLEYPASLDLSYPAPVPGKMVPWDNQKNISQFVWDVVNPNPSRWRSSGLRLFHHLADLHKNDSEKQRRCMSELGAMYFRFEQDYPRAAYWLLKSGIGSPNAPEHRKVDLAECYWQLGCKQAGMDLLKQTASFRTVKLLSNMGEIDAALTLADQLNRQNPPMSFLYAGDVCRVAGDNAKALTFYEKTIRVATDPHHKVQRIKARAEANLIAIKAIEMFDPKRIKDGTYTNDSTGYEGPVVVQLTIKSGKIHEVKVIRHSEKQYYSSITNTCRQIVEKQGIRGVDATSGATITSSAIINAVAKSLAESMK